ISFDPSTSAPALANQVRPLCSRLCRRRNQAASRFLCRAGARAFPGILVLPATGLWTFGACAMAPQLAPARPDMVSCWRPPGQRRRFSPRNQAHWPEALQDVALRRRIRLLLACPELAFRACFPAQLRRRATPEPLPGPDSWRRQRFQPGAGFLFRLPRWGWPPEKAVLTTAPTGPITFQATAPPAAPRPAPSVQAGSV